MKFKIVIIMGLLSPVAAIAGCATTRGSSVSRTFQDTYYFEMIDKTELSHPTEVRLLMRWNRVNAYCDVQVRRYLQTLGYNASPAGMQNTYINCVVTNNFGLVPTNKVHEVVAKDKKKYGMSFVIERDFVNDN